MGVQSQQKCFQVKLRAKKGVGVLSEVGVLSSEYGTSGRQFKQASTWVRVVVSSSKVSFVSPTMHLRCFFMLRTAASHKPPKCGERSGMNLHSMPFDPQNSETICCVFCSTKNSLSCCNPRFAPTKLVPWSLQISEGCPRRATNRRRAAMKVSVVKLDTS